MKTVSLIDARNRLTELAREVEDGQVIVVTRNGRPVFDLVPHKHQPGLNVEAGESFLRSQGIVRTVGFVSDDFDEPLAEDFLLKPLS